MRQGECTASHPPEKWVIVPVVLLAPLRSQSSMTHDCFDILGQMILHLVCGDRSFIHLESAVAEICDARGVSPPYLACGDKNKYYGIPRVQRDLRLLWSCSF